MRAESIDFTGFRSFSVGKTHLRHPVRGFVWGYKAGQWIPVPAILLALAHNMKKQEKRAVALPIFQWLVRQPSLCAFAQHQVAVICHRAYWVRGGAFDTIGLYTSSGEHKQQKKGRNL